MKILIAGARGKLGSCLQGIWQQAHEVVAWDLPEVDLTDYQALPGSLPQGFVPDVVANAAAMTAVDRCESESDQAYLQNYGVVRNLVQLAALSQARLVHFSTDFVFDGQRQGQPYCEYDAPNPLSVYGHSKLAGEQAALAYPHSLVLRLAWLYGPGGWNFTDWVADTLLAGQPVRIVTDQFGCPSRVRDVAQQLDHLLNFPVSGLYHCVSTGSCSRYDWAAYVCQRLGLSAELVQPLRSSDLKQTAVRPLYSVLDNFMLRSQGLLKMPSWQDGVKAHLSEDRNSS